MIIDAHQHFWDLQKGDYTWLAGEGMREIQRNFQPQDLQPLLQDNQVDKTILVQTQSSIQETWDFLEIAGTTDFVAGVVGWIDLIDPDISTVLQQLCSSQYGEYLVGIRHQVHDEADENWLSRDDVQNGLQAVADAGLVYDLLTRPRELTAALETVKHFPNLRFVIDHISKPDIANNKLEPWRQLMQPFTEQTHVYCKLSGMITEANWQTWTADDLKPYIDSAIEIFTPDRLIFGSDWPVCTLAGSYAQVKAALERNIERLPEVDQAKIMGANAIDVYRLNS